MGRGGIRRSIFSSRLPNYLLAVATGGRRSVLGYHGNKSCRAREEPREPMEEAEGRRRRPRWLRRVPCYIYIIHNDNVLWNRIEFNYVFWISRKQINCKKPPWTDWKLNYRVPEGSHMQTPCLISTCWSCGLNNSLFEEEEEEKEEEEDESSLFGLELHHANLRRKKINSHVFYEMSS